MADPVEDLSPEAESLLEGFRKLPSEEQRRFAYRVLRLAEAPDLSPEWRHELTRRVASVKDGTAVMLDGEAVVQKLRAKYRRQ